MQEILALFVVNPVAQSQRYLWHIADQHQTAQDHPDEGDQVFDYPVE
jgi:hypothetical protein